MKNKIILTIIVCISFSFLSCNPPNINIEGSPTNSVNTGLDVLFEKHLNKIIDKNIALVTNHSGLNKDGDSNVSMFLSNDDINLIKIFTPEHGFTGNLPAGEKVDYDSSISNLPSVISLYGKTRKPTLEMLQNVDLIIYDIQDVGVRFYTYISTLGLVMEAAAKATIPIMVLDRPNPISYKVDGPILKMEHQIIYRDVSDSYSIRNDNW